MAETCLRFGCHGARVMIEDTVIPHYAIQVDAEKKEVTCWIASEAEKSFSVEWLKLDVRYPTACELYLDGRQTESFMRRRGQSEPILIDNGIVSDSSSAPFLFSPLVATDDDAYLEDPSHLIGEIKLVVSRTSTPKRISEKKSRDIEGPIEQPPSKIHETKKKGMVHHANFGTEIPRAKAYIYKVDTLERLVSFFFKYQPLEILRANGTVPCPKPEDTLDTPPKFETSSGSSKPKKEAESESESDDKDSMRIKALLAEVEKIRKGKQLKNKRPKKKLKKDENPIFTPGEIIDLT